MLKQTLALVGLTLSLSSNAAIIDLGSITRDTSTGLDWLDLSETLNLSYDDVVAEMANGGNYEGWRYATKEEVMLLWENFGVQSDYFHTNNQEYMNFLNTVSLLGNTLGDTSEIYDYGVLGLTGTVNSNYEDAVFSFSVGHLTTNDYATKHYSNATNWFYMNEPILGAGSYLVRSVPIPTAVWLFGSALVGLVSFKRKK